MKYTYICCNIQCHFRISKIKWVDQPKICINLKLVETLRVLIYKILLFVQETGLEIDFYKVKHERNCLGSM